MFPKDMFKAFEQFKGIKEKVQEMQDELKEKIVEADSGGGMVKVIVNGKQEVLSLEVEKSILLNLKNDEDIEMLEDLIISAVNSGIQKSQGLVMENVSKLGGGIDLSQFNLGK
ncbi:MAG: YbaB/EbfC family nucleoid-associated protein [Nitrospinae bacterium]|nr:YbaB/EbfC family nucleoid-associated protein [Nitrospinota bacterium]